MNESQTPVPPVIASADRHAELKYWLRRLLACNPCYLVSAACLLYGLYKLTPEPAFRAGEVGQLTTIFGSLQLYELLVVGTAILLARRFIWYDSTLLVTLENMFVFVPFILVTLAMYIGNTAAWIVCLTGAVLAVGKFLSLKRLIPALNLPARLLALGAILLAINLSVPFYFRSVHEVDSAPLAGYSLAGWMFVLPGLLALINALPIPVSWGSVAAQRSWLPAAFAGIWITVSAVHQYCIGYIYDLPWRLEYLAPLLWVAAWSAYNRVGDFTPYPRLALSKALLVLPAAAMLFGETPVIRTLAALNVALYAIVFWQERDNRFAYHLGLISLATMFATMPVTAQFSRERWIEVAAAGYVIVRALLSADPRVALGGAAGITLAANHFFSTAVALQAGFVFALAHSIFWQQERHAFSDQIRALVAMLWVIHSWAWMHEAGATAGWTTAAFAFALVGVYLLVRLVWYYWASRVIPVAVGLVVLWMPITSMPVGFAPVVIAFGLFGLGTLIALRRDKWLRLQ